MTYFIEILRQLHLWLSNRLEVKKTRERLKSRPKLPQSIAALADELIHYTPISHIYKGSVTASDGKTAFLFSDDKLLIALESSNEIYCDGTFSVSLTTILQLFCVGTINKYRI